MEDDFYFKYSDTIKVSKLTRSDVKNLIQTGESSFLEFKHRISTPEKVAREMAAFANYKGGTILVGVTDSGEMVGVEGYFEEEFLLNQAAKEECVPEIPISIELVHLGDRDILYVNIPEAEVKPVYVKGKNVRQVYVRQGEESVLASDEYIEVLKLNYAEEGVSFQYGEKERQLFRFLHEYGDITIERLSAIANITSYRAAKMLVNLVSVGILDLYDKDGVTHYTFSHKTS